MMTCLSFHNTALFLLMYAPCEWLFSMLTWVSYYTLPVTFISKLVHPLHIFFHRLYVFL